MHFQLPTHCSSPIPNQLQHRPGATQDLPEPRAPVLCHLEGAFFPLCKGRRERREKGLESELRIRVGELFLCPILAWQGLHSTADVLFPWHGLRLPPPGLEERDRSRGTACPRIPGPPPAGTGTICQHHGFAWVAKGARQWGRTWRMPRWHCCFPGIHHSMAGNISLGIFLHCGSARLVILAAEHMQDPEETSPLCRDTHSAGGRSRGQRAATCTCVPWHVFVSLLPRERLTPLARAWSLASSPP